MNVRLDLNIFKWLFDLQVITVKALKQDSKVELDEPISLEFMNGHKVGQLIRKLANVELNLKEVKSTGLRLYNWNIIADALNKLGVTLDNDIKILIVQGDTEMLNELLKDVMDKYKPEVLSTKVSRQSLKVDNQDFAQQRISTFELKQLNSSESRVMINELQEQQMEQDVEPNNVRVDSIDTNKPLEQTQSLLEFLLTGLCRHLKLKPKQAVGLLANNNKYLAHVMVKGQKNQFKTILDWLMDIHSNLKQVEFYVTQNQEQIQIFFQTLRSGLLSRSPDVATWTLRIYHKLTYELINIDLIGPVYEWFVQEHGGLQTTFLCLKRHPELGSSVVQTYSLICQRNINDFFNIQFRKILSEIGDYIDLINILWEHFTANKILKDELLHNKIIDFWGLQAFKLIQNEIKGTVRERIIGFKYAIQQWIVYPTSFQQDPSKINQFLFLLKKASRDRNQVLRYYSLECLMRILDHLAAAKNAYASLIYKKTTFSLIENYGEPEMKQFIISNLIYVLKKYNSIPIETILINSDQQLRINISDFELFRVLCLHPKLDVALAVQILDVLSKIYLSSIGFALLAFSPLQLVLSKFVENQPIQEFCFNLIKVCLSKFQVSLQSGSNANKAIDQEMFVAFKNNDYERKRIQSQQRAQIIELVKFIINLQQFELNAQIKPVLVHFYLELNKLDGQNKGILTLLTLYGNPEDIIQEFQLQQNLQTFDTLSKASDDTKLDTKPQMLPQFLQDDAANRKITSQPTLKRNVSQSSEDSLWDSMPKQYAKPVINIKNDDYFEPKIPAKRSSQAADLYQIQLTMDEQDLLQQFELL